MLHTTSLGEAGPRVAFCHGLFGQGKNFTQMAKELASDHRVTLIDLPDHGRSPWSTSFSYVGMADQVAETLARVGGDEPWALVGHSMGAKTAMLVALRRPELVDRLAVVDMSPVAYRGRTVFEDYVAGMRSLPLDRLTGRAEADELLQPYVPEATVRAFLLQNLRRDEHGGFRWQMNLQLLGDSLADLAGWPADELEPGTTYGGPVLWLAGAESRYVRPEFGDAMRGYFPRTRLVTVKGAGHWVHSEQPAIFTAALRQFLSAG